MKAVIHLLLFITCLTHARSVLEPVVSVVDDEDDGFFELMSDSNDDSVANVPSLPRLSRAEKWELIRASGQDPLSRRRGEKFNSRHRDRRGKRDLLLAPWRIAYSHKPRRVEHVVDLKKPLVALPVDVCPEKFDAVARGYNGRTYLFHRDRVYQVWNDDGLPQKSSFLITDFFPGGPRTVTAALTNSRSGVTILLEGRKVYRFRWNRKNKRFQLAAKKTPQDLPRNITINPTVAFEWSDGNQILMNKDHFIIYDAYWNVSTFLGHTKKYFPNLPNDILGVVYNDKKSSVLIFTKNNKLKVFNVKKFKVVQEYPLSINEYVGCIGR